MVDPKLTLAAIVAQYARLHQSYKIVRWQLLLSAKAD